MNDLTITREVSAPAGTVWDVVTDLERSPEHISGIQAVERLDGGTGFAVGTRWRETRTMFGKTATETMEVTAVEAGRAYTVEADGNGAHYTSRMIVEPRGESASTLTMTFGAEPQGGVAKLMAKTVGKLFEGATRKAIEQDLDDIAATAEARA